jgi:hypothetical protein
MLPFDVTWPELLGFGGDDLDLKADIPAGGSAVRFLILPWSRHAVVVPRRALDVLRPA